MTEVPSGIGSCAVRVAESKSSASRPVKMCVVNEGQREPARLSACSTASTRPAIVAPGDDEGRDILHRLFGGGDRPSHRCELVGLFHPAELVHERRPGPQPVETDGAAEVQDGLRPHAVADGDGALYAEPADDALERSVAIVGLGDDDDLALGSPR